MRLARSIALIFVSILFFQCQKEVSYVGGPNPLPNIVNPDPITTHLQGNVFDENGLPAPNVTIKAGNQTAVTDSRGYFRINNAALDKKSSVVTAEKSGYFKAYRTFAATSGTNQVEIKLIPRVLAGTIDAAAGGEVSFGINSKVSLPANGVVLASNNAAYTGQVRVYAAYIDPTAADIHQTVPGSFMATDKNGSRVILSSFGMMAVELESSNGDKLQIKPGSKATITQDIPSSVQSNAPQTIALWSVDEQSGLWEEEGSAAKQGNVYVGEVSHFSFWNCDVSVNAIYLTVMVGHNNNPLPYTHVKITRTAGYPVQTHGYTDSFGVVHGWVPNNEVLLLEVVDYCGNTIYSQNIGPFTQNPSSVSLITLPPTTLNSVTVEGTLVDCNNNPVTNGTVMFYYGPYTRYITSDGNGDFSTVFVHCNNMPSTVDIIGFDNNSIVQSNLTTVNLVSPLTNSGNILVCGNSAAQYINYTLNGSNYVIGNNPSDSLLAYTVSDSLVTGLDTWIMGFEQQTGGNSISIKAQHPTASTGTYPVDYVSVGNIGGQISMIQPGSTLTFTNFPAQPGDYYEGNFNITFLVGTTTYTLTGNFRVRK